MFLEDSKLTLVPSPRLGQSKTQPTRTTYRKKRILTSVTCGQRFDLSCNQEMSINCIMIQFSAGLVPHIAVVHARMDGRFVAKLYLTTSRIVQ